jgi:hypothetical protein
MGKFANTQTEIGDIHAPIEDTDVPFSLKLLVVGMFLVVVGVAVLIVLLISHVI